MEKKEKLSLISRDKKNQRSMYDLFKIGKILKSDNDPLEL